MFRIQMFAGIKSRFKFRAGRVVEGSLWLLEGLAAVGLVSGAVLVAAIGKLVLGGLLGVLGLGVWARMHRRMQRGHARPTVQGKISE
ncbi:hypothetical protein [Hydrogenophaga soli]